MNTPLEVIDRSKLSTFNFDLMGWIRSNLPQETYVRLLPDMTVQVSDDNRNWLYRGKLNVGKENEHEWDGVFWLVREVDQPTNCERYTCMHEDLDLFMRKLPKMGSQHPYDKRVRLDSIEYRRRKDDSWMAMLWYSPDSAFALHEPVYVNIKACGAGGA